MPNVPSMKDTFKTIVKKTFKKEFPRNPKRKRRLEDLVRWLADPTKDVGEWHGIGDDEGGIEMSFHDDVHPLDLYEPILMMDNDGSFHADPKLIPGMLARGYVTNGEWLFQEDQWMDGEDAVKFKLITPEQNGHHGDVLGGYDTTLCPLTYEARAWAVRAHLLSDEGWPAPPSFS